MRGLTNKSSFSKQIPATCLLAQVPSIGWQVWANDSSGNQNMTDIQLSFGAASPCAYSGSGAFKLLFTANCRITTTIVVDGSACSVKGATGTLVIDGGSITGCGSVFIESTGSGTVQRENGGRF
jgi:hypothetical protein